MARVIRSDEADSDIYSIANHIAADNLEAALRWLDTIDEKLARLAEFPGLGPARDELAPGLRSFPVGNYIIAYRRINDGIEVVRVLHGARELRRIFRRFRP